MLIKITWSHHKLSLWACAGRDGGCLKGEAAMIVPSTAVALRPSSQSTEAGFKPRAFSTYMPKKIASS